jgi:hypothetical protein
MEPIRRRGTSRASGGRMTDDLARRSGKGPEDAHPEMGGGADDPDPSDYGDPRVTQAGDDPAGEDALGAPIGDADRLTGRSGAGDG